MYLSRTRKKAIEVTMLVASLSGFQALTRAETRMTLEPAVVSITQHEPVVADLRLWNLGSSAIETGVGEIAELYYRVTVTQPNGARIESFAPLWARGRADFGVGLDTAKIAPGQSEKRPIILSEWYDFDEPGRYAVSISMNGIKDSANLVVDVQPRDESRLQSLCDSLSKDAMQSKGSKAVFAARELSFVSDNVAIPYLTQVASHGGAGEYNAVDGLTRLGNLDSVAALRSVMRAGTGDAPLHAKQSLEMLRLSTKDISVKQAIDTILSTLPGGR